MKTKIINPFLLTAMVAGLNLNPAGLATAQTFTTLHNFTGGSDGGSPYAGLVANPSGNTLYGTTLYGGISGVGGVFAVNADGSGFTTLYRFTARDHTTGTNSDGADPGAGLILSGNTLYGTTLYGGSSGFGTVFAVNTDGTGFVNLHSFTGGSDGAYPNGLILSGNSLYGTAIQGGTWGAGTVFKLNANGTDFTNLYSFEAAPDPYTNSNGAYPRAGLILSGDTLYGTSESGGSSGNGTIFAVHTSGTGFTNLHNFAVLTGPYPGNNSDGATPRGGLILLGSTLYGTAVYGGSSGIGTLFAVQTNGAGFTTLHNFTPLSVPYTGTNSDGAYPVGGLIFANNMLYGTATAGGGSGYGTVFAVKTDGTGFTTLHSFTGGSDGVDPIAGVVLSGNTLFGAAYFAGTSSNGTVFSLSFRPRLTITPSGANVVLTWPTNVAGFDYTGYTLQSTTNLVPPAVWSTNSPVPVIIGGQNAVINPITGPQRFYRLSQ